MQIRVRDFIRKHEDDQITGDYEMIAGWFASWELECPPEDCLPRFGYIVEESVCGFLYLTDSGVCLIDCFISDPSITSAERDSYIDVLVQKLIFCAQENCCRVIVANSIKGTIRNRALKHGFNYAGEHGVFYKGL